jgi:hypothetical protein
MASIVWILIMALASEAVLSFLLRRATRWMR